MTTPVPVNRPVRRLDARAPLVTFLGLAWVAGVGALLRAHGRRTAPARLAASPTSTVAKRIDRTAGQTRQPSSFTPETSPSSRPQRLLRTSAALLGLAVLADSGLEHYRGSFRNPAMYAPLAGSSLLILINLGGVGAGYGRPRIGRSLMHLLAGAVGTAGLGFHLYNIGKRPGGYSWLNFFYAAPFGAPAALSLAALIVFLADLLNGARSLDEQRLMGMPPGRAIAGIVSLGLAGTVAEVLLLHFRGAFHNPFMWLPVSLPPVSSALMAKVALSPGEGAQTASRSWLWTTALLGIGGMGFHAYGISRNMGGWRNWSQNILAGPPLPAPPSFSALALAGIASLDLIAAERRHVQGARYCGEDMLDKRDRPRRDVAMVGRIEL